MQDHASVSEKNPRWYSLNIKHDLHVPVRVGLHVPYYALAALNQRSTTVHPSVIVMKCHELSGVKNSNDDSDFSIRLGRFCDAE